jgi:hypothetical protein
LIILCQRFLIPAATGIATAGLVEFLVFEVLFQEVKVQWRDLTLLAMAPVFLVVSQLVRNYTLLYGNRLLMDLWKDHRNEVPEGFSVILGEQGPILAEEQGKAEKKEEEEK